MTVVFSVSTDPGSSRIEVYVCYCILSPFHHLIMYTLCYHQEVPCKMLLKLIKSKHEISLYDVHQVHCWVFLGYAYTTISSFFVSGYSLNSYNIDCQRKIPLNYTFSKSPWIWVQFAFEITVIRNCGKKLFKKNEKTTKFDGHCIFDSYFIRFVHYSITQFNYLNLRSFSHMSRIIRQVFFQFWGYQLSVKSDLFSNMQALFRIWSRAPCYPPFNSEHENVACALCLNHHSVVNYSGDR